MEQYNLDKKLYKWMRKNIYKRHPKWNKRKWVRFVLYGIIMFSVLIALYISFQSPTVLNGMRLPHEITGEYTFIDYLVTALLLTMVLPVFPVIATFSYCSFLRRTCRGKLDNYTDTTVILSEESLSDIFRLVGDELGEKTVFEFPYESMEKIVWNDFYQRYEINGVNITTNYSNYEEGKVSRKKKDNWYLQKEAYHLYWIFYDRDKFESSIEERTGLKIRNI